jgi:hypothetical protein
MADGPNQKEQTFDLIGYLDRDFSGFGFGGDVLGQWTLGLRFNIGLEHVDRAVEIYKRAFGSNDSLVLISEDWPWDSDSSRWYSLFSLPRLIQSSSPPRLTSWQPDKPIDDELYTVTWAVLPRSELVIERLFQAIANQDHGRTPSVRGRVYILDPSAGLLLHMYDDRGLDVIATSTLPLLPLHERFSQWINEARLDSTEGAQRWRNT